MIIIIIIIIHTHHGILSILSFIYFLPNFIFLFDIELEAIVLRRLESGNDMDWTVKTLFKNEKQKPNLFLMV
jgi:hypothetical protein